ncbi:Protein EXECUTER 1, chloroplastic [Heracleum sosnowskyi]|uniref:Protein EXECUTER 1, chloroplastic n=1 Tax=Heracleum sosnowskyi TaxID=360622 RepID=A0AAD8IJR9_9APIA|nr:Protein EXECUTER 1, chloroplastic [Heracleum sosnowskyi]
MAAYIARRKVFSLFKTTSFTSFPSKNLPNTLALHSNYSKFSSSYSQSRFCTSSHNSANAPLIGWWFGVSEDAKCPYGQIIHISAEHGRYLARSYSPWQLATAKSGTPIFEIYITTGLEGEYKEQAIYIKHKEACPLPLEFLQAEQLNICTFPLTEPGFKTDHEKWVETMMKVAAATEQDIAKERFEDFVANNGSNQRIVRDEEPEAAVDSLEEKNVIYIAFVVGDILEKNPGTLNKNILRVPLILERNGCFSFRLMLEEDKGQLVSGDYNHEVYRSTKHGFLHVVDCIGRGIPMLGDLPKVQKEENEKSIPLLLSRAQNQQPLLSQLTTFNRIDVPASPDPLIVNGLYLGSNGYFVSEVIQIRSVFGPWNEVGGMKEVSELELCEYIEAVNLTGDFDMPAGQVAFRAKVGEKYKLRPGIVLEQKYGAVARYKGKGRFPGFQNSEWVDVEVVILGLQYRCIHGLDVAVLYTASEYYFMKFFKQLYLQSFQESH